MFSFIFIYINGQKPNDAEIKTALIYNFLKYIENDKIENSEIITLGYFGKDHVQISLIKNMQDKKVKGNRIEVREFKDINDYQNIDVLYIFNEYNFEISKIYKNAIGSNTLLITDRYNDKTEVMINFIHVEDKVQFEVNNKNIDDAGFHISPKLLLLGGTELDVRQLYKETEKSLLSEREKVNAIEKELNKKQNEVSALIRYLANLHKQNDSLNDIIKNQINEIEKQKIESNLIQVQLSDLYSEVENRKIELNQTNSELITKNSEKGNLDKRLNERQKMLEAATNQLSILQADIDKKEKVVIAQQDRIALQSIALLIFIAFFVLFIVFIVYIYGNYKAHKRKNLELENRNVKINTQKEHIQQQANDLANTNNQLELEKRRAEEALKKLKSAQSQLVSAEKMVSLGQLTSGIAHEINNPVNYISSNIEGVRNILDDFKLLINEYENSLDPKKIEKIDKIKNEIEYDELFGAFNELTSNIKLGVDRTKEIVSSLRTFARMDDDNVMLTDIHQNIDLAIILMGKQNKRRINIIKDYGDIPDIECVPGKMSQVFMNILVNAVQAIKEEGEIIIKTKKTKKNSNHYILISVTDNGEGIKQELINKIFEPFFTTKDVGEGTGLGLSITYSIIKNHNGFIEVDSKLHKGTTFKIYLPIK